MMDKSGLNNRGQPFSGRKLGFQNPKNNSSAMSKLLKGLDLDDDDLVHGHHASTPIVAPPIGLKSGYTGYVPRLRYHYGSSYNPSSNEAKKEFNYLQQVEKGNRMELDGSLEAILYAKYGQQLQKPLIPVNDNDKVLGELLKFEEQRKTQDRPSTLQEASVADQGHIPTSHQTINQSYTTPLPKFYDDKAIPINHPASCDF